MDSKKTFKFAEHPLISFWSILILVIVSMIVSAVFYYGVIKLPHDDPYSEFIIALTGHFIMIFFVVPFLLKLPFGEKNLKVYLEDIRFLNFHSFSKAMVLFLSCYIILAFCQSLGSFTYRLMEGKAITNKFIYDVFNIKRELPPQSLSILVSFPSMFEEVIFRGVLLTLFLTIYSKSKAIIFSSLGFSIIHIFNMLGGRDPIWVIGQIIWAFLLGIFYGYLFIQTGSLIPNMLFHYMSNLLVGSFNWYIQSVASVEMQVIYGIIFTFGLIPSTLMIIWTRFFTEKFPFETAIIK